MKKYIAEQMIPQEVLKHIQGARQEATKNLTKELMNNLIGEYEPGQLIMLQTPKKIPSPTESFMNMAAVRMAAAAEECIQCKHCEWWTGHEIYEATLDDYTRGICHLNLRMEAIFAPPTYAVTFANDYCSSAKRRITINADRQSGRDAAADSIQHEDDQRVLPASERNGLERTPNDQSHGSVNSVPVPDGAGDQ